MGTIAEVSVIRSIRRNYNSDELLHRIIEENIAGGCGNKPALIFNTPSVGETKISYNMLNCAANKIAANLIDVVRHRELQPNNDGDYIVAVCMSPSDDLVTTLLAILKMGAAYLPIDPTFPSNRVDHILKEAKPVCVIYDDTCVDRSLFGSNTLALSYAQCMIESHACNDANIPDDQMLSSGYLGLVLYTSGSTGVPKGKTHFIPITSDQILIWFLHLRCSPSTFGCIESIEMAMGKVSLFADRDDWRIQDRIDVRRFRIRDLGTSTQW